MTVTEYNSCVDQWSDNLFRFILKNLRNEEKARDVVQDSFVKLWLKVDEVRFEKAKSYLFSTGYHTMIDLIRRDKKMADFEEAPEPSYTEEYSGLSEILHRALQQLPEIQRSVVMLRDYEGYNYKEVGEITNLNESQVKVYIYRARKFLKDYIGSIEAVL